MINNILNFYTKYGVSLSGQNISSAIIPKKYTLELLELFYAEKLYIVGGDIYIKKNNLYENNYEGWFFPAEGRFEDSIEYAKKIISDLNYDCYISFVFKE